jgi:MFS transporter, DHA1 family, multidrug resistance protein
VFLAVIGAIIFVASASPLRETLPAASRQTGGLAHTGRVLRRLLSDRVFLGVVLISGCVSAALFAYLSGATFILQGIYGLSPQGYSFAFGLNSLGFMVFGFLAGRTSARWSVSGTLMVGLAMIVAGSSGVLITATAHLPLAAMVLSLLTMVSGVAVTTLPSTALALQNHPDVAGSASSLLGLARFAFGGLTAPLVGPAGAGTAIRLGIVTITAALLAVVSYTLHRPSHRASGAECQAPA